MLVKTIQYLFVHLLYVHYDLYIFTVLQMERRALRMLGKHSTSKSIPASTLQPDFFKM